MTRHDVLWPSALRERARGRTRAAVGTVIALVLVASSGCSGDGSTEVHAIDPAAISEPADRVATGHFEVVTEFDGLRSQQEVRIDGSDASFSIESDVKGTVPTDALWSEGALEFRIIDDDLYLRLDTTMSHIAREFDTRADGPGSDNDQAWFRRSGVDRESLEEERKVAADLLESMVGALSDLVVDHPGNRPWSMMSRQYASSST